MRQKRDKVKQVRLEDALLLIFGLALVVVLFVGLAARGEAEATSCTITIRDGGRLRLSGDAALGQYDGLVLWCDGTRWVEVGSDDE